MGKKRKRPAKDNGPADIPSQKRAKAPSKEPGQQGPSTQHQHQHQHQHPVISLYYSRVVTLRQYLLDQLPASSKSRRRRIASVGLQGGPPAKPDLDGDQHQLHSVQQLADLLDSTLVGVLKESNPAVDQTRQKDFAAFTASQFRSPLTSTDTGPTCPQAEIVDFVILTLFNRIGFSKQKPRHLLTHGFQRATAGRALESGISGLEEQYPNQNAQALRQAPWTDVLALLGGSGEEIMMRLLLDCGIFRCLDRRRGVFYQISGVPLSDLEPVAQKQPEKPLSAACPSVNAAPEAVQAPLKPKVDRSKDEVLRKPNSIIFVRRRMLYARPALNAKGNVRFGLRHIHVLNRFPSPTLDHTVHVMKYIFPRQFGLHNVFTSKVDTRETVQPLKDYTVREDEIVCVEELKRIRHHGYEAGQGEPRESVKIPKRLRGKAVELVQRLQRRNNCCPYTELLRYYCPVEETGLPKFGPLSQSSDPNSNTQSSERLVTQLRLSNQSPAMPSSAQAQPGAEAETTSAAQANAGVVSKQKPCLTDYATPASSVSAFCRAVLKRLIPNEFLGVGEGGISNRQILMKHVDRFVRLRRFESLSLHEVCKGLKVTCIAWLESPKTRQISDSRPKLSLSDLQKRTELLHELVYYIFDSLLIPLIRTNFYVTESQIHRNRVFYFRHDVWRRLSEQPLADLKSSVFEEIKKDKAQRILARRSLGYSALRLLPKASGARPIVNLGRRTLKKSVKKQPFLEPSINSLVTPIFNVLNYERARRPDLLGSAILSVSEIHPRLKKSKENLLRQRQPAGITEPLFFVKLDIQSCFDTIPQHKVVQLIESLLNENAYRITKHVEIRPSDLRSDRRMPNSKPDRPFRKFFGKAAPVEKPSGLPELVTSGATRGRTNAVFVDLAGHKEHDKEDLLDLLEEHVRHNLVKIGKKYFRQRNGIPQGSVLSSLLCNFFYADMEREILGFLNCDEAVLLRLIDDFLLITSKADIAMRFLEVMIEGQPEYGVSVNPEKSLVNFEATVKGIKIPRLVGTSLFPYCGVLIDTHTLELQKDRDRVLDVGDSAATAIADSLTVESARAPGRVFRKKVLTLFKIQVHPMYLDTGHNSAQVVLSSLYASFVDSAMRMYRYLRSLRGRSHPSPEVIIGTIRDLISLAVRMIQSRRPPAGGQQEHEHSALRDESAIGRPQIQYLAAAAFRSVLGRKQTRFAEVLRWLNLVWKNARPGRDREAVRLAKVVREGNAVFAGWRF